MKELTLNEIIDLPKASVIWEEEHTSDDESGYEFFSILPMMIGAAGRDGVMCYADQDICVCRSIDDELITPTRKYWDAEPGQEMVSDGMPIEYFNTFNQRFNIHRVASKGLLSAITKAGYSLEHFSQETGITVDELRSVLIGETELSPADKEFVSALLNITDDHVFDQTGCGKVIDIKKAQLSARVTQKAAE